MDVATGAIGSLLPKLRKLLEEEHNLSDGEKYDIQFIIIVLESMRAVLRKAAEVPPGQLDPRIRLWAREAPELSYRIEGTVDRSHNNMSFVGYFKSKLMELSQMDARQTRVAKLPKEVVHHLELTHLLGQSIYGSSVYEQIVDSRECSASVMEENSMLTYVKELILVLYDGPADKKRNDKLLSSICQCRNLKSLTIYGDSNPSDKLIPASRPAGSDTVPPNFPQLRKLKVAGRFAKVPRWIAELRVLTLLYIRVCKLEPNDMRIFGDLPWLINLALVLVCLPREQIVITSSARFLNLEVFTFDCRVPWVTFEQGAMPRLKHLELKLYAGPASKCPSGIVFLQSLNKVILRYASQYASSDLVTKTVYVMKKEAGSHANLIMLSVNGVDQETFSSNTSVDRRISGTEIEE